MRVQTLIALLMGLLLAYGCAGGGGGGLDGGRSRAGIFITDDLNAGYDHVWVTIQKVTLEGPAGNLTVFDSPAGKQVDLSSLRDDSGSRFALLSNAEIRSGHYVRAIVQVDKDLVLFPTGSTSGQNAVFADSAGESKQLILHIPQGTVFGNGKHVIVDFDLRNWNLENGTVTATGGSFLRLGDDSTLRNQNRHEREDYHGTVANLSGTSFTLQGIAGSIPVQMAPNVVVFNENGGTPTLANGQRVEVTGTFDVSGGFLVATIVKIDDDNFDNEDEAEGQAINGNLAAGTFTLIAHEIEGFLTNDRQINVVTTAGTRFFTRGGIAITKEDFFAAMAIGGNEVKVDGTFDSSTNTITARRVRFHHEDGNRGESKVEGTASSINAAAGSFSVTARDWEGVLLQSGDVLSVTTTAATEFRTDDGRVSQSEFFAALQNGARVEARGAIDPAAKTVAATRVEIDD